MDSATIITLGGIVVVLILIGVISSLLRGRRGKPDPMDRVVDVQPPPGPVGPPPPGSVSPGADVAPPSRDPDSTEDELEARSEDEMREADAEEQEDVARRIEEEPGPRQPERESSTDGDVTGRDENAQHGRHRPRDGNS